MADELADLEAQVAAAKAEADTKERAEIDARTELKNAKRRMKLEAELAAQLARLEPDSASDEVVLPGRELVEEPAPSTPSASRPPMPAPASSTSAAPKVAATEEGN